MTNYEIFSSCSPTSYSLLLNSTLFVFVKVVKMSISISAQYTYHDLMWMTSSLYQNNSFLLIFSRDRKCLKICDYIIHGWKTNLLTYISPFLIWCWKLTFVSYNQLWAITRIYWARTWPHSYVMFNTVFHQFRGIPIFRGKDSHMTQH